MKRKRNKIVIRNEKYWETTIKHLKLAEFIALGKALEKYAKENDLFIKAN